MPNDSILFQKLSSEAMPLFEQVFEDIKSVDKSKLDNPKEYFVSEMYSFYSLAKNVLETYNNVDNAETVPELREMLYPIVRRLLESYFRIMYIFDESTKTQEHFESYLKYIEKEYDKMLKDLLKYNYPTNGLNPATNNYAHASKWPRDLKTMLSYLKNNSTTKLTFLYPKYRILCFYAHGNINKSIMDMVFSKQAGATNNFSVIEIPYILSLIASYYFILICEFWPDIKAKHTDTLKFFTEQL